MQQRCRGCPGLSCRQTARLGGACSWGSLPRGHISAAGISQTLVGCTKQVHCQLAARRRGAQHPIAGLSPSICVQEGLHTHGASIQPERVSLLDRAP